jgi:surface protein
LESPVIESTTSSPSTSGTTPSTISYQQQKANTKTTPEGGPVLVQRTERVSFGLKFQPAIDFLGIPAVSLTWLSFMFASATDFNKPLSSWNTGKVLNMKPVSTNATRVNK